MRLIITPLAEQDIEDIAFADYIAQDNPRRAVSFVRELYGQCKTILANPLGYRLRAELADDIRSCAYSSYVIFFSVVSDVLIVRVLHGARDMDQAFSDDVH